MTSDDRELLSEIHAKLDKIVDDMDSLDDMAPESEIYQAYHQIKGAMAKIDNALDE